MQSEAGRGRSRWDHHGQGPGEALPLSVGELVSGPRVEAWVCQRLAPSSTGPSPPPAASPAPAAAAPLPLFYPHRLRPGPLVPAATAASKWATLRATASPPTHPQLRMTVIFADFWSY